MIGRYAKTLAIFSILLASIAYPNSHAETGVMLSIDKRVYFVGDSIIVTGIVQAPSSNVSVIVQVWNPSREMCSSQEVNVSADGTFVARPIKLSGRVCSIPGTYTITAFYGEQEGNATFEVQAPAATQNTSERLQTLLDILNKAKQNIDNKMRDVQEKGIGIPDDIMKTYDQALVKVQQTKDAVAANNAAVAKEHAKNAMSLFREIFKALTLLEEGEPEKVAAATPKDTEEEEKTEKIGELRQAILLAMNFKNRLANIAATSNVEVNFADFDAAIQEAARLVEEGNVEEAKSALVKVRQILNDIQKSLTQQAKDQRQQKAKAFVEKTIERIDEMIENAKSIGLPQDVIDALENAKAKLLAAKNINEIIKIAKEIKVEKDEFKEYKGKNFERAVKHLESKLEEAKNHAEKIGISVDVFARIQGMIEDAKTQWAAGETENALSILEKAEQSLKQIVGTFERAKQLLDELNKLANAAEELKGKATDNQEALDLIDRVLNLINNAKKIVISATSQHDLQTTHNMYQEAKQLLERVRHMIESKVAPTPSPAPVPSKIDADALKRMAEALEDRAERLKGMAEEQQNREAMSLIMEAIDLIQKAKGMISEENYDDAKALLRQANELLNKAERILKSGSNVGSKPSVGTNEEEAKAMMQEISVLEAIAAELKVKAGDNREAHMHINEAVEDLNDAKESIRGGELDEARSEVNSAKGHLKMAKQIIDSASVAR